MWRKNIIDVANTVTSIVTGSAKNVAQWQFPFYFMFINSNRIKSGRI